MRRSVRRILTAPLAAAALAAGWAAATGPAAAAPPAASPALTAAVSAPAADAGAPALRAAVAARAALATPLDVITARGDTLSSIAAAICTRRFWPEIWWANRHRLHNPNVLPAKTTITVPPCGPTRRSHRLAALAAIPPPPAPPPPAGPVVQAPAPGAAAAAPVPAAAPPPPAATGSVTPSSAYEACVISAESGGNAGAVNASSGAGGLYQFLPSTWAALGYSGAPQDASPATQQAAFDRLYAQSGSAPWSSDGCG